jgi:hypothetical protein
MDDPTSLLALSGTGLLAVGLACAAGLRAWRGWLELRRQELNSRGSVRSGGRGRVEVVELRARVRRLEAIANGAEL